MEDGELAAGSFLALLEPLLDESDDVDELLSDELVSLDEEVDVDDFFEPVRLSVL